jgi:hypothetical protein
VRPVRVLLVCLALAACTARAQPQQVDVAYTSPAAKGRDAIRITAQPLPLDPANPQATRLGRFTFAGEVRLTSPDTSLFGGFSDLKVTDSGALVSETDDGNLMRARIRLDATGRLAGLDSATLKPLTGPGGGPLQGKVEADAEGIAIWPSGELMVSFERDHRIWLYPKAGGDPRPLPMPRTKLPDNAGMEALALAPSQGPDAYWVGVEGGSIWLCRLKAQCVQWTGFINPPFLHRLPALTETPDGRLAILHHSWTPLTGNHVRLSIVTIPNNPNGASRIVDQLVLGPDLNIDNFEGLAAVRGAGGKIRFYMISDDNFQASQRTLLAAFDWTTK